MILMDMLNPTGQGGEVDLFPWLHHLPTKCMQQYTKLRHDFDTWMKRELSVTRVNKIFFYIYNIRECIIYNFVT